MLIDSHCHLDFPDYDADRDFVIRRAREAGIGLMLTISTKLSRAEAIIKLAESYPDIVCTIGIHPHEAEAEPDVKADDLIRLSQHEKVVGLGETGLDYFHEHSNRKAQKSNFLAHIEAARQTGLPLIVHTRDADEDMIDILTTGYRQTPFTGLIHCFTAGAELAKQVLDIGFYISISGIVTFKSAHDLRDIIKTIPLDRLLVETDAPYLAPVPHRGKRNEPGFVTHTAQAVADIKNISVEELAAQTSANFYALFTKATPPTKAAIPIKAVS